MSTKTTIKRIALVAVASLGFGMVTGVAAKAAVVADAVTTTTGTSTYASTGVAGSPATINLIWSGVTDSAIGANVATVNSTLLASPLTSAVSGTTFSSTVGGGTDVNSAFTPGAALTSTGTVAQLGATGRVTSYITNTFSPDKVGTYVIKFSYAGGVNSATSSVTWTLTVSAKGVSNTASSTAVTSPFGPGSGTDADGIYAPKGVAGVGTKIATIAVTASNGDVTYPLVNGDALAKSATISGPGLISWDNGVTVGRAVTSAAGTLAQTLTVYADGNAGVGTITITDGNFVKTKTITFYGDVVSLAATHVAKSISDIAAGTGQYVAVITAKDAAGVNVPLVTGALTVSSATEVAAQAVGAATAVNPVAGTYNGVTLALTDVVLNVAPTATKTGSKTLTVTHTATGKSTTVTFTVALPGSTTVTLEGPADSLVPGQKYTVKVTSKDAGGFAVPDGTRALAVSTSRASSVAVPVNGAFINGVASIDLWAPVTAGDFALTVADGATATSTITIAMGNPAQDSIDAANEATDAANAATDAANAAAEAADAATAAALDAQAAVAELATKVASLIAGIKAQITTLTNLVIKIQKKVRA